MVVQIEKFNNNTLFIEVIDGFTETDEKYCQQLFDEKVEQGFEPVNLLVKLDEMKLSNSSTKAFFEDMLYLLRNYKKLGHLAIVAHSNIMKVLIPIDSIFFSRASKGRQERYFDISQMDEAKAFVMLQ
ncbi:STAS/SEC14 domain-containing protein [Winogradskyella sp. Asnod2-B02-A]|uniref:STAS/SEC14 domain-containing protein n=1 Tax=Winogradskyella sp. Asnod2-B02-A TaxID=3160583 RepID=UPI0038694F03